MLGFLLEMFSLSFGDLKKFSFGLFILQQIFLIHKVQLNNINNLHYFPPEACSMRLHFYLFIYLDLNL